MPFGIDLAREESRIDSLYRHAILDTGPEAPFERLVAIAARMFDVPIAQITLVDRERQWFKALRGLSLLEGPRSEAFCARTIEQDGVTVVTDAVRDPHFAGTPLVAGAPFVRFYAGAPLRTSDGFRIGALGVLDTKPRVFSDRDRASLLDLAAAAADALELRLLHQRKEDETLRQSRNSEQRLQLILQHGRSVILEFDGDGNYLNVWAAQDALLVKSAAELVGRNLREVVPERVASRFLSAIRQVLETRERLSFEYELEVREGRRWFAAEVMPLPGPAPRVAVSAQDITALKQREEELRHAAERFELVSRATNDAVWDWDLASGALWWNRGLQTLFGHDPADCRHIDDWVNRVHAEDVARVKAELAESLETGASAWSSEYRFLRADGGWADVFDRGYVMRDAGKPVRMIGAMMDVTSARQSARAQGALTRVAEAAASARGLPALFRSVHEIVATLLPAKNLYIALHQPGSQTIDYAYFVDERDPPPAGPEKLGRGATAWVLRNGRSLLASPEDFAALERAGELELVGPACQSWVGVPLLSNDRVIGALVVQSYDPSVRYAESDERILQFVSTQVARAIERKQAEAQLLAADRMASVGMLAAGVAHEINNPLAYVVANLSLVTDELVRLGPAASRPMLEAVGAAAEGAERVRQIVRGLKTFSRSDDAQAGPLDVHRVLRSALDMAWNDLRHRARLVESYDQALPPVYGNEGRLGQVFLNLIVNAAQSMPEREGAPGLIRLTTRLVGDRVVVEVEDSGSGIAPADLERLFDPFFTTKPVGVGTGLGLFICRNIIDAMGGSITVESQVGRGSLFRVALPASTQPGAQAAAPATPVVEARRARILVVDDEPQIGSVLKRAFKAHDAMPVTSAEEALARIRSGANYDLILCDVMMPHMSGIELHAALLAERPDLAARMVFMTGGAFTERAREFLDRVPNPRIEKPFDLRALRAKVQELLSG